MRNKRFPNYPDDTDYTTNSPSYYDDLARKQKLIQLLAEKIWKYENTLDETLEQIEQRLTDYILENDLLMNERLGNWDQRIDEMPEEMRSLFVTWLNDGTLEQIINHDVLGNKADQSELDKTNEQLIQIAVNIKDFNVHGDGTEESEKIQDAIDYTSLVKGTLIFERNKEYICANLQLRDNIVIDLNGSTLKCPDDAYTKSINGSLADTKGVYSTNVIGTTLTHTGGSYYDNGVRAKNIDNNEYIVKNVVVKNGTIDGNKQGNPVGDKGLNASSMGNCVSLCQAYNVTLEKLNLINARMDGVFLGFTLHGGSDFCTVKECHIEGAVRCGIAQITGKYNKFLNNRVIVPNAAVATIDVEANFEDEINFGHEFVGNYIEGEFQNVAIARAYQHDVVCRGNIIKGNIVLSNALITGGSIIENNIIYGDGETSLLDILGAHYELEHVNAKKIVFRNNSAHNFLNIISEKSQGGVSFIDFIGNTIQSKYGFYFTRSYDINISGNKFKLKNGTGVEDFLNFAFSSSDLVQLQGKLLIKNNSVEGNNVKRMMSVTMGVKPPQLNKNDVVIEGNTFDLDVNDSRYISNTSSVPFILNNNRFSNLDKVFALGGQVDMDINGNTFNRIIYGDLFEWVGLSKKITMNNNTFDNCHVIFLRPEYNEIDSNKFNNSSLRITYANTEVGIGSNIISNNKFITNTLLSYAISVGAAVGYDVSDFSNNDVFMGNIHIGSYTSPFTSGASTKATKIGNTFE